MPKAKPKAPEQSMFTIQNCNFHSQSSATPEVANAVSALANAALANAEAIKAAAEVLGTAASRVIGLSIQAPK